MKLINLLDKWKDKDFRTSIFVFKRAPLTSRDFVWGFQEKSLKFQEFFNVDDARLPIWSEVNVAFSLFLLCCYFCKWEGFSRDFLFAWKIYDKLFFVFFFRFCQTLEFLQNFESLNFCRNPLFESLQNFFLTMLLNKIF